MVLGKCNLRDPLDPTDDGFWLYENSLDLCDCAAKDDPMMCHSEFCSLSPIYASIVPAITIAREQLANAQMMMTQTVICCAICGRERLGRDLLVIYQAPLTTNRKLYSLNGYPQNIVKAVCPEHNRTGVTSYQAVAKAGYGA